MIFFENLHLKKKYFILIFSVNSVFIILPSQIQNIFAHIFKN